MAHDSGIRSGRSIGIKAVMAVAGALICAGALATPALGVPQLAYNNGAYLYLRAANGSGVVKSVHAPSLINGIYYSPGGERIALEEGRYDGAWTDYLQVCDASTGKLTTVYHGSATRHSPIFETWSPNGRWLIFELIDTPSGYLYDTSTGKTKALTTGDLFSWSPNGSKIAIMRGNQVWVMSAPAGTPTLLADMTSYVGTHDTYMEWSDDSSELQVGYHASSTLNQVWSISATGLITDLGSGPRLWERPHSRVGGWGALDTVPAELSNGSTSIVVGPNRDSSWIQDVSSDGSWVSLMDWWGGQGQWWIWTCQRGGTPRHIATGFVCALRSSPLASLTTPLLPSVFKHGTLKTATGSEYLATGYYPGGGTVKLEIQKWYSGAWHAALLPAATLTGSGTRLGYSRSLTFAKGTWRIRAVRSYSLACAKTASGWRTVKVW
jgi:hypothetical protein